MRIEFTAQDETQPTNRLEEGNFVCTITKAEVGDSKTSGNPMVTVEFMAPNSKTCLDYFVLTAGQKFKLLGLVKAVGLHAGNFDTEQLLRKQVTVTRRKTGSKEYEGKIRDNFENTYSPAGPAKTEDDINF